MENDKFRIKLKSKEDGSELMIFPSLTSKMNGLLYFPIELDKWEIFSCNQTTGLYDKFGSEIFFNDQVKFENDETIFVVVKNAFNQETVVDGDTGQMDLHRCRNVVEVLI